MPIYTHDLISITSGLMGMGADGVLWGGNAIQTISINRHTPRNPVQAVGYLGVVDYTRGVVTSDLSLEVVLTEGSAPASVDSGVYKYAVQQVAVGVEIYVMTMMSIGFTAGNPATASYGYITASLASALATQAQPAPSDGLNAPPFAVVLGDNGPDGGVIITASGGTIVGSSTIGVINDAGEISTISDGGIPGGLQRINFNARINRDQVLDVRSTLPVQFVTTYPLDLTADAEVFILPGSGSLDEIGTLDISAGGTSLVNVTGLVKVDEQETVSVGRFLGYTYQYLFTDIQLPVEPPPTATLTG